MLHNFGRSAKTAYSVAKLSTHSEPLKWPLEVVHVLCMKASAVCVQILQDVSFFCKSAHFHEDKKQEIPCVLL